MAFSSFSRGDSPTTTSYKPLILLYYFESEIKNSPLDSLHLYARLLHQIYKDFLSLWSIRPYVNKMSSGIIVSMLGKAEL